MNRVEEVGRLTKDPMVVYPSSDEGTEMARFILAVQRRRKKHDETKQDEADFIPCVAFGKRAVFVANYLKKGDKIAVSGHLRSGSYEKDGVPVYTLQVVLEEIEFAGGYGKNKDEETGVKEPPVEYCPTDEDGFMDVPEDIGMELPFN